MTSYLHPVWLPPFWIFVGVAYTYAILKTSEQFACDSLPIGENRMKKF